ncbi:response regulator [Puniceibacterium sediminis]|uniref:Response regulator receiver protein n=1 Tax=Puniceibacterium sediminis TaxID=1608407 RepID=A0A238WYL8_9RHOB|nr:response regulator [Puniceibacterium sediminis]SNR51656.1 response regulator receiver protein [Puniceibacterium sediminis]
MNMHVKGTNTQVSILLVEDDDGDAKAVRRAFAAARISNPIIRLTNGAKALQFLKQETEATPPRRYILLVDVNMPVMNGHEMVAKLRETPELNRSIVFMLTTSDDERDINAAYDNLVAGYILKQTAGRDFLKLMEMLGAYWRLVEIPDISANCGHI